MNINDFRAKMQYGGARTSLFQVRLTNPIEGIADLEYPFFVHATSLPGSTVNPLELRYFGRAVKFPANREFDNWDVTIYNDENFLLRNALESWAGSINGLESNIRKTPSAETALVKSDAEIIQFSKTNVPIRTYRMIGIWPQAISPIDLTWESDDIQRFSVSFSVDYYITEGTTGNSGGV